MKRIGAAFGLAILVWGCKPQGKINTRQNSIEDQTTSSIDSPVEESRPTFCTVDCNPIIVSSGNTGSGSTEPAPTLPVVDNPFMEDNQVPEDHYQICGIMYNHQYTSTQPLFKLDGDTYHKYYQVSQNKEEVQRVFDQIRFPDDSYEACVWGKKIEVNNNFYIYDYLQISQVDLGGAVNNPFRTEALEYSYELCGEMTKYRPLGGTEVMQINFEGRNHILEDMNNAFQYTLIYMTDDRNYKGCVYGNSAPYNDFRRSFKKYFKVEKFNGFWNK